MANARTQTSQYTFFSEKKKYPFADVAGEK
jgi:hypothetical protein